MLLIPPIIDTLLFAANKKDSNIHIRNYEQVRETITAIMNDGFQKLHIISDFDMTLTRYWLNGKRSVSSHGVLERSSFLSQESREALHQLYLKYYPIEIDKHMPLEEKIVKMIEWWDNSHDVIIASKISKSAIAKMLVETQVCIETKILIGHFP
jgi:HAD superfamily hydrolase (TIGR01544 family)